MLSPNTRTRLVWRDGRKVREHRWLMEQHLRRKLRPDEQVHHKNGNPLDNRLENLEVLSAKAHMHHHKAHEAQPKPCANCGTAFTPTQRNHKRQKCCSPACAQAMRINAALQARGLR